MAQGDLAKLLAETRDLLMVDTAWYRTFLDIQAHVYKNSVANVTEQVKLEVGEDFYKSNQTELTKLISQYMATLYQRIAKTPRNAYRITESPGSGPTSFEIYISPMSTGSVGKPRKSGGTLIYDSIGADPFKRIINVEKRAAIKPLLDFVNTTQGNTGKAIRTTSTFLGTGHAGLGVAEKQVQSALTKLNDSLQMDDNVYELAKSAGVLAKMKMTSKWTSGSKQIVIEVTDESANANRSKGATGEKTFSQNTLAALQGIIKENLDWANQKGSDSMNEYIANTLMTGAQAAGATVKGAKKPDTSSSSATADIGYQATNELITDGGLNVVKIKPSKLNPQGEFDLSLISLINKSLPETVRSNMVGDALHNRTGRFSNSVYITGVTITPQGYPSLNYTYQRSPYDVFDPVLGREPWNTPGRDPKPLIEKSIRQIAQDMAIGRFYARRA